ncbi:Ras and Rab interactor 2/3 [Sarotherodon galilaeus]
MKYKNIVQTANRKKAEARKRGGGPPPPPLTEAEQLALSQNSGHPVAEGISAGTSSESITPQDTSAYIRVDGDGVLHLVQPPVEPDQHAVENNEETLTAVTEEEATETLYESDDGNAEEEGPATSPTNLSSLPVKQLYKTYLIKKIKKCDLEMEHFKQQIQKTKIEILLLEHQLRVGEVVRDGRIISVFEQHNNILINTLCTGNTGNQ